VRRATKIFNEKFYREVHKGTPKNTRNAGSAGVAPAKMRAIRRRDAGAPSIFRSVHKNFVVKKFARFVFVFVCFVVQ